MELADNEGGSHFENNDDLLGGLREVSPPETHSLLAFTPSDLTYDGRFHP